MQADFFLRALFMYKNNDNEITENNKIERNFSKINPLINEHENLTTTSNRRLKYQNVNLAINLAWSIDRITVVGKLKQNILWDGRELVDFEMLMRLNEGKGYLIPVGSFGWEIIDQHDENIAYIELSKYQKGYGRIDFNPNKINVFVAGGMKRFIHKLFLDPHFSRADVACDLINVPDDFVAKYRIIDAVSTKMFWGRGKNPETIYWGARSSEKQVRLYNKKIEQEKKKKFIPKDVSSWWRFEAQLRRGKASEWHTQIIDTLNKFCSTNFLDNGISGIEKAVLSGLIADESLWAGLGKTTRAKYRKLFREESQNDELTQLMRQTFSEQSDKLKNELDTWLAGFDVSEED